MEKAATLPVYFRKRLHEIIAPAVHTDIFQKSFALPDQFYEKVQITTFLLIHQYITVVDMPPGLNPRKKFAPNRRRFLRITEKIINFFWLSVPVEHRLIQCTYIHITGHILRVLDIK